MPTFPSHRARTSVKRQPRVGSEVSKFAMLAPHRRLTSKVTQNLLRPNAHAILRNSTLTPPPHSSATATPLRFPPRTILRPNRSTTLHHLSPSPKSMPMFSHSQCAYFYRSSCYNFTHAFASEVRHRKRRRCVWAWSRSRRQQGLAQEFPPDAQGSWTRVRFLRGAQVS